MRRNLVLSVAFCLLLVGCDGRSEHRGQEIAPPDHSINYSEDETKTAREHEERRTTFRGETPLGFYMVFTYGWWLVYYAIGFIVGSLVYRDARTRKQLALNIRPIWWFAIVVFDAPLGLLVYWVLNYSNLGPRQNQ